MRSSWNFCFWEVSKGTNTCQKNSPHGLEPELEGKLRMPRALGYTTGHCSSEWTLLAFSSSSVN